jgi:hypothetical protein
MGLVKNLKLVFVFLFFIFWDVSRGGITYGGNGKLRLRGDHALPSLVKVNTPWVN